MIFDYLRDYGARSFDEVPLNDLDLLVLAGLSYFDFPAHSYGLPLTRATGDLRHFKDAQMGSRARFVTLDSSNDERLRELVSGAHRYDRVIVRGFASDYSERSHQFAAVSMTLDDVLLVAFRGTDESLTGWNEALQLSLDEHGVGQLLAAAFLDSQAATCAGPIISCGHSKGGNLAAFAATTYAGEQVHADRIAAVVSFDGPGLSPHMRASRAYASIASRIRAFIPKSSFIGNINEHPQGSVCYIESRGVFEEQHAIYNWETHGTSFVPCRQSLAGRASSDVLGLLVDKLDDRGKNRIFDAVFFIPRLRALLP